MICGAALVGRNQDIRERLVVPHQHVEARPQALDQVRFEQQRLGLGLGRDEFERCRRRDHAGEPRVRRPQIGDHALADVLGFADVEHLAAGIDHAVDAGRGRRVLGIAGNRGAAGCDRARVLGGAEVEQALEPRLGERGFLVLLLEVDLRIDVFLPRHAVRFPKTGPGQSPSRIPNR